MHPSKPAKSVTAAIFIFLALTGFARGERSQGITLFNQYKPAEPTLKYESKSGDPEVLFYLAESVRENAGLITPEALTAYEASANAGNYYAMIRLGRMGSSLCSSLGNCPTSTNTPEQWMNLARKKALAEIEKNANAEAMYVMFEITSDPNWLKKSADHGYAIAEYWMALKERQGGDFFFSAKSRNNSVKKWFRLSAEHGNPKAMLEYAAIILQSNGDLSIARHWIEEAAKTGYEGGVTSYGSYLAHEPDLFGFQLDLIKGYAMITLLLDLNGGGNVQAYVSETLPKIAEKMTREQIEQAKEFATDWKKTHPPLSFYPDKLGYQQY